MAFLTMQDTGKIHYASAGEGKGLCLFFVHSAGTSGQLWKRQVEHFSQNYRPIAIDLPGHGQSEGEPLSEIGGYASFLKDFMEQLGLEKPILIGNSMGGGIALFFALLWPERLRALVLVGTGARLRVLPALLEDIKKEPSRAIETIASVAISEKAPQEARQELRELLMASSQRALLSDFLACDSFDIMGSLPDIKLPTLIVCGDQDQLTPLKYSQYLANHLPRATLCIIDECGHGPMLERPERFNSVVESFIRTL